MSNEVGHIVDGGRRVSNEVGLKIHCCCNDDISHKTFCQKKTPPVQRLSLINCNRYYLYNKICRRNVKVDFVIAY